MTRAEYAAWRRENHPDGLTCEYDDRALYAKGLCWPHYKQWNRTGYVIGPPKPKGRPRGHCENCGGPRPKSKGGPKGNLCTTCKLARTCAVCGYEFTATNPSEVFCSDECRPDNYWNWWAKRNPERLRQHRANRRAHNRTIILGLDGGEAEHFDHQEIFDRDDWTCGICGEPVDPTLAWSDPDSVSLDHILPLSSGGRHTRNNTRCSHLGCNIKRGAAITPQEYAAL